MWTQKMLVKAIHEGRLNTLLDTLYGERRMSGKRLMALAERHEALFGVRDVSIFSAPGRVELGGNHTDHQNGLVLAAAVDADMLAAAAPNGTNVVHIVSEGFPDTVVDLNDLLPREKERGTTAALVRGCAAGAVSRGISLCGIDICITSNIPTGGGLSSSAAFEVLIAGIFSAYSQKRLTPVEMAQVGQFAENRYFGKPCGLMDQCASACGGIVQMDFRDSTSPEIEQIPFRFAKCGHTICAVDSGAGHENLTEEYAAIPTELASVCAFFGKSVLREIRETAFYEHLPALRAAVGDRAVLRAMHVFAENRRVEAEAEALRTGDFSAFLCLASASGNSSALYLQNVTPCGAVQDQALALTLAVCSHALNGKGACRVHGGGFAGAALAFVPDELLDAFQIEVNNLLGKGKCRVLRLREPGFAQII